MAMKYIHLFVTHIYLSLKVLIIFCRYVNFMVPLRKPQPAPVAEHGPFQLMSSRKTVDSSESQNFYDYYNCIPPPLFIITITVLEIAYFFIDHSNGKELLYDPSKRNEFWRFITYVLVHVR